MADPLITLMQLKGSMDEFPDPTQPHPRDAALLDAINSASALVRNYTGLRFELTGTTPVATPRTYEYDGSGYLDIDECQTITGVTVTAGYSWATPTTLSVDAWAAEPYNEPVKRWLRLPEDSYGMSPAMGFTWNLDRLYHKYPTRPNVVTVTGAWGWPAIPADVQRAVIWTALSLVETPTPYQQESIEGYSRTRGADAGSEAIPDRAQVALLPYIIPRL